MSTVTLSSNSLSGLTNLSEDTVRADSPNHEYSCSFCHTLFVPEPSYSPFLAGSKEDECGERYACSPCQKAITSLSACWRCSTILYRGADALSFGWTFWCRSCYSCAFCRFPLPVPTEALTTGRLPKLPVCKLCRRECCRSSETEKEKIDILSPSPDVRFVDLFDPRHGTPWKCRDSLKRIPFFIAQRLRTPDDHVNQGRQSIGSIFSEAATPSESNTKKETSIVEHSSAPINKPEMPNERTGQQAIPDTRPRAQIRAQQMYYSPSFQHPRRALVPSIDTSTLTSTTPSMLIPKPPVLPTPPRNIQLAPIVHGHHKIPNPTPRPSSISIKRSSHRAKDKKSRRTRDDESLESATISLSSASITTTRSSRTLPIGMFLAPLTTTTTTTTTTAAVSRDQVSDVSRYFESSQSMGRQGKTVLQSVEMYEMNSPVGGKSS